MTSARPTFHELAANRQSIRQFTGEDIHQDMITRLLETACRAPSAHNRQPWRFVILPRGANRVRLVESMSRRFRADLEQDGVPQDKIETLVERGRLRLLDPPLAILLCMTMEEMEEYPDPKRAQAERTMAIQSVALAGGQLLLAAHAEGLGACWVCAPLFTPEIVRQELDLPDAWEAQGVLILGWPDESGRDRSRRSVEEVSVWR